jgi:hypothetical protein
VERRIRALSPTTRLYLDHAHIDRERVMRTLGVLRREEAQNRRHQRGESGSGSGAIESGSESSSESFVAKAVPIAKAPMNNPHANLFNQTNGTGGKHLRDGTTLAQHVPPRTIIEHDHAPASSFTALPDDLQRVNFTPLYLPVHIYQRNVELSIKAAAKVLARAKAKAEAKAKVGAKASRHCETT